jgi:SNF2 family DNA or RNA helicase
MEPLSVTDFGEFGVQRPLTDKYKSIETPARLRARCELLPHQKTIVAALIELEDKRVVKVVSKMKDLPEVQFLRSNAIRLNERYGSGKTLMILALIAERPIPKAFPNIRGKCTMNEDNVTRRNRNNLCSNWNYVEARYNADALIRPNLVVVSSGVLIQWETAILKFTDFKVLTIGSYYDMLKFQALFQSGDIRAFDIVLLKNGKVMGKFDFSTNETDSSINIMNIITKGRCWSRVIYDDFDTINIPMRTEVIESLFTIFVSATEKLESMPKEKPTTYDNIQEMIVYSKSMLKDVFNDSGLMGNFSIKATQDYTEMSTKLPKISQFECVYVNPNDNIIRLAGAMNDDEAREIVEMLNSDAPDTAAARLGIKSNSVADIFQRMLGQKHERLLNDNKVLDVIAETRAKVKNLDPHPKGKQTKMSKCDDISAQIRKKNVPAVKYYCGRVIELLDDLTVEYTASRDHNRLAIDRVIDNIKEGDCQICQIPLVDESAFIVRCCGIIVCSVCCVKGNQIALRYHYASRSNILYGKCANCKSDVLPHQDLIYVDNNFNLDDLIGARGDEAPEDAFKEDEPAMVEEAVVDDKSLEARIARIENPKHRAIISLCHGMEPENAVKVELEVKGLILGNVDRERPAGAPRKILIFAPYSETIAGIENTLLDFGISYVNLKGTAREKALNVEEFKTKSTVMLANSKQDCAGLDLQVSDCVVFYNNIFDANVEGQIAGRIQRFGRVYNGRIYRLKYQNETAGNFGA